MWGPRGPIQKHFSNSICCLAQCSGEGGADNMGSALPMISLLQPYQAMRILWFVQGVEARSCQRNA